VRGGLETSAQQTSPSRAERHARFRSAKGLGTLYIKVEDRLPASGKSMKIVSREG
jgi:hypothetical protein